MPDTFRAATWNVHHASTPDNLEPTLQELLGMGVSLFYFQELANPDNRAMVRDAGLQLAWTPRQYAVAWTSWWVEVNSHALRLSDTPYWAPDADGQQFSDASAVLLCDRSGRSLDAVSYHTPSGVQTSHDQPQRRVQATRESFRALAARARASECRASLYAGDDNVDERFGRFRYLTRAKGLHQVQAPGPTFGRRRKIDDFRHTSGLRPGQGQLVQTHAPDDHRVHVRLFAWT